MVILHVGTHAVGFVEEGCPVDVAHFPNAATVEAPFLDGSFEAVGEAAQAVERAFQELLFSLGRRGDEIKFLVADFGVAGAATVDECLHLPAHRVEVDRRRQHDDIGLNHLLDELCNVVFLRAGFPIEAAYAAPGAVVDVFVGEKNFLDMVPFVEASGHEAVTQGVGVSAPSRA